MAQAFIEAHWEPNPGFLAGNLERAAAELADLSVPVESAKEILIRDTENSFDSESDPFGLPWAQWSESYSKSVGHKHGPLVGQDQILTRGSDLRDYATSDEAWQTRFGPDFGEVEFDGSGMPEYGAYHLTGTFKMPARVFIGLSPQSETEIAGMFGAWGDAIIFGEGVEVFHSTSGQVVRRGAMGRFVPNF